MNWRYPSLILLLAVALLWPLMFRHVAGDVSVYAYIGSCIAHGLPPYQSAWDIKSPAIFFQYALPLWLFPRSDVAVMMMDGLIALAGACAIFWTAVRLADKTAGAFAAVAWIIAYHGFASQGWWGQPETAAAGLMAFLLFLALQPDPLDEVDSFLGGLVTGVLVCYKLPFLLLGALLLPRYFTAIRRKLALPATWPWLFGLVLVVSAVVFYFAAKGALYDLYVGAILSPFLMTRNLSMPLADQARGFGRDVWLLVQWLPGVLCFAVVGAFFYPLRHPAHKKTLRGAFFLCLIVIMLQTRYFPYYWLLLMPVICIYAGLGMSLAAANVKGILAWQPLRTGLIVGLTLLASIPKMAFFWSSYFDGVRKGDKYATLANYATNYGTGKHVLNAARLVGLGESLRRATAPNETILSFDMDPALNFYSGRMQPARFIYLWPLLTKGFESLHWKEEYTRNIIAGKPTFFLLCRSSRKASTVEDGRKLLERYPELKKFLAAQYIVVAHIGPIDVYRRKDYRRAS
ncbi:MAG TPA: hypothetical protein VFG65_02995 [Fimbriimonadales bacterium]|nr:hypothetical protein [Fimbriimonadales bacterium]